jgi:hypothetical protein
MDEFTEHEDPDTWGAMQLDDWERYAGEVLGLISADATSAMDQPQHGHTSVPRGYAAEYAAPLANPGTGEGSGSPLATSTAQQIHISPVDAEHDWSLPTVSHSYVTEPDDVIQWVDLQESLDSVSTAWRYLTDFVATRLNHPGVDAAIQYLAASIRDSFYLRTYANDIEKARAQLDSIKSKQSAVLTVPEFAEIQTAGGKSVLQIYESAAKGIYLLRHARGALAGAAQEFPGTAMPDTVRSELVARAEEFERTSRALDQLFVILATQADALLTQANPSFRGRCVNWHAVQIPIPAYAATPSVAVRTDPTGSASGRVPSSVGGEKRSAETRHDPRGAKRRRRSRPLPTFEDNLRLMRDVGTWYLVWLVGAPQPILTFEFSFSEVPHVERRVSGSYRVARASRKVIVWIDSQDFAYEKSVTDLFLPYANWLGVQIQMRPRAA